MAGKRFIAFFLLTASASVWGQGRNDLMKLALRPAQFELVWTYKDLPFKIRVFQAPRSMQDSLFKMANVDSLADLSPGPELTGKVVTVGGRGLTMLYLVVQNTGDKPIHFSAAPHHVNPVSDSLGFSFKCLCFGHVYTVEPNKFWYRIVKLEAKGSQSGKKVRVEHAVFRVTEKP